jgi:hypothetical protein
MLPFLNRYLTTYGQGMKQRDTKSRVEKQTTRNMKLFGEGETVRDSLKSYAMNFFTNSNPIRPALQLFDFFNPESISGSVRRLKRKGSLLNSDGDSGFEKFKRGKTR